MVLTGHIEVSAFIKNVHEELREKSKTLGVEKAWQEHCADSQKLEKYALAMKELATKHWEKSDKDRASDISRISWIYQACIDYFLKEISNIRIKEAEIATKLGINLEVPTHQNISDKLRLLDVGSCYNPFKHIDNFEVFAIDIAPAVSDVLKCDFLKVQVGQTLKFRHDEIEQLPENYFDIVVFSLLLEYLPSPLQRRLACKKAYNLLKYEGILLIVTPDSNHVGSNSKYIKSWRFILSKMGFSRVKYEKLKHIHCMIFRKSVIKDIPVRWANIHKHEQMFDEIFIPQDFKIKYEVAATGSSVKFDSEETVKINEELPFFDVFE